MGLARPTSPFWPLCHQGAFKRYSQFIKVAADQRRVWGPYKDGWALAATEDGVEAFPLWPAPEYAAASASGAWTAFAPREVDLVAALKVEVARYEVKSRSL